MPMRLSHVVGVARRASELSVVFGDEELETLLIAAVLHDVGYAPNVAKTGFHALDGARYLQRIGMSTRVCGLVAHHSCAYREAELRGLSGELAAWLDEGTALRDALWWADMTTTPDGEVTTVRDRIDEIRIRYGPEHLVSFFVRQAERELVAAVDRTEDRLLNAERGHTAK